MRAAIPNMRVYSIHQPHSDHLEAVKHTMRQIGPPVIRVVDCGPYWVAIEGTHRLRAACDLEVPPQFVVHSPDEDIVVSRMDIFSMFPDGTHILSAREVASECLNWGGSCYRIREDGRLSCEETWVTSLPEEAPTPVWGTYS